MPNPNKKKPSIKELLEEVTAEQDLMLEEQLGVSTYSVYNQPGKAKSRLALTWLLQCFLHPETKPTIEECKKLAPGYTLDEVSDHVMDQIVPKEAQLNLIRSVQEER